MFSRTQKRSIYRHVEQHGFHIDDFTFQDGKKTTITHINSGFYFKLYVGHTRVSDAGTEQLLTAEYTPSTHGVVLQPDKAVKLEALDDWHTVLAYLSSWLTWLSEEYGPLAADASPGEAPAADEPNPYSLPGHHPLGLMHRLVHYSAGPLFVNGHYPQALLAACTALDKTLQQHTGQPAELTGTALMNKVFSPENPLIRLSPVKGEQQGYLFMFNGLTQAIRNHYAHNLTELSSAHRALEWLGFISVLCHQIESALMAERREGPSESEGGF